MLFLLLNLIYWGFFILFLINYNFFCLSANWCWLLYRWLSLRDWLYQGRLLDIKFLFHIYHNTISRFMHFTLPKWSFIFWWITSTPNANTTTYSFYFIWNYRFLNISGPVSRDTCLIFCSSFLPSPSSLRTSTAALCTLIATNIVCIENTCVVWFKRLLF